MLVRNQSAQLDQFPAFVDSWLNIQSRQTRLNIHLVPNWLLCDVCRLNVDYIIKAEHLNEETSYLAAKFGLNLTGLEKKENVNVNGVTSEQITSKFMDRLSFAQKKAFYQIYEPDFKLFGYSFYPFC